MTIINASEINLTQSSVSSLETYFTVKEYTKTFSSVDLYTNQSQSNKSYPLDNLNYLKKKKNKVHIV